MKSRLPCGGQPVLTAAPPAVTLLDIANPGPTIEVGHPLCVRMRLASTSGLWMSRLNVTGPISAQQDYFERR